jgi:EAL domain-containing protein (putative c-di-GMP-specific phosphodiesterase class I)
MPMGNEMPKRSRAGRADLTGLRLRLRPGFLLSYSLAGLVGVGLLAFAISRILSTQIRSSQLTNATASANLLASSAYGPRLSGSKQLKITQVRALDQATLAARRASGLVGVGIWDNRSQILYSSDHRLIGKTIVRPAEVESAVAGETSTVVGPGTQSPIADKAGKQIDIAVPIYDRRGTKVIAVAEIALPYAPVAEAISAQTKRIDYVLFGAALLFYALLWPRLLRASRAIRTQAAPEKQALLRELENGIKRDELLLHYQPTIDLGEGRVVAVEALLRWQHPKRGLLAPSEFLPTLTDDDLNGRLTLHVVGMALRDCGEWRDRGIDAAVNVNLSVSNVIDDAMPEQIGKLLATCGIPPAALGLEVTETAIVADPEKAAVMLEALHRMGVRIAIDDYGTGYSSLACLRDLPISELKVDREFVVGLRKRPRDEAIVRSTIRLAHELDVKVIAEGVEDQKTVAELVGLECDMAQGYYFSPPLSLPDLVAWFEAPIVAGGGAAVAEPAASVTGPPTAATEPATTTTALLDGPHRARKLS